MKVSYYILTQSILFLNDETLEGRKKEIYVLMKIMKFCTDSDSKSYQVKFAISEVLRNRNPGGWGGLQPSVMSSATRH